MATVKTFHYPQQLSPLLALFSFLLPTGIGFLWAQEQPSQANVAAIVDEDDTFACLSRFEGPIETLSSGGEYTRVARYKVQDGSRFDARGMVILQRTRPTVVGHVYPVDLRLSTASARACWAGGAIINTNPYELSWEDSKYPNSAAIIMKDGATIVDGVRIHNAHDGVRPWYRPSDGGGLLGFELRNSWLSNIRDDCVENDARASGIIEDTLFDGCYVFLSARSDLPTDSKRATIVISNNLIHMRRMPEPYGHHGESIDGHGQIFKFDEHAPYLAMYNNLILVEDYPATRGDRRSWRANAPHTLSLWPGRLIDCRENVVIWLGAGDYPGESPAEKSCVTFTKDHSVWDDARRKWLQAHPQIHRLW